MKTLVYTWIMALVLCALVTGCRDYSPTVREPVRANDEPSTSWPELRDTTPNQELAFDTPDVSDPIIAGIYLNAGCSINPDEMAVAAGHAEAGTCEHILATAYTGTNGDMDETAAPITWSIADWSDLTLDCIGAQHNLCTPRMGEDYFSLGETIEPESLVTACTTNICPEESADCMPTVCASVLVKSAINLEGPWVLDPISEPPELLINIWQTGRSLFGATNDLDRGFVSGFSVLFDRGDYRYIGVIAPDRAHIEGYALDLISFLPAGSWSAYRP